MAKFREEIVFAALLADRQMAEATVHQDRIVHILEAVAPLLTAPLEARVKALEAALRYYADQYCEGWCREHEGVFEDCGGCTARAALTPEPRT